MKSINLFLDEILPIDKEFEILFPSFVDRISQNTVTDPLQYKALKLPKWEVSPTTYKIKKYGSVYSRHFTQDFFRLTYGSEHDFIREQKKNINEYLKKAGLTIEDVFQRENNNKKR